MSVGAYCQRNPRTARAEDSVRDAAVSMTQENVGALLVNDAHDRPVGIVTDRDLVLRCTQRRRDPDATRVGDVMSQVVA